MGATTYETGGKYASRIAGILAGTPADCSATYAPLPEVTGVDAIEDADAAINSGKLVLINDGRQVKLGRAVTSKTTVADGETQALKKIKMVAAVDLIRYYALTTIEDNYQGKCSNTYDNKCVLVTAISAFLQELEAQGVLNPGESWCEIDVEAQQKWMQSQGVDTASMTEQEIREYQTGSWVFIKAGGRLVDAMEDFQVSFDALSDLAAA